MLFGSTFIVLQNADLNIGISTLDGICGIAIGTSFTENHR